MFRTVRRSFRKTGDLARCRWDDYEHVDQPHESLLSTVAAQGQGVTGSNLHHGTETSSRDRTCLSLRNVHTTCLMACSPGAGTTSV